MRESLFYIPEGETKTGKRYSNGSAEVIVTRGSLDMISDGNTPFTQIQAPNQLPKPLQGEVTWVPNPQDEYKYELKMGKRYNQVDPYTEQPLTNGAELLVIKAGRGDLMCGGVNMKLMVPKVLPGAD